MLGDVSMERFEANPVWPGWQTVRQIGRGSYGAVYEIERDVFGHRERAALKVITIPQSDSEIEELRSDGLDEESITRRFRDYLHNIVNEYSMMADMKGCANIVYCDDVRYIQHDDGYGWDIFIKMELLTPLISALKGEVPEAEVIRIGRDLGNALAFCESRKILHRDIKPQNIFRAPDGTYKLGDFGVAKTVEKTTGGTIVGTYKYMAPEVYYAQPYGGRADLYSLGLVLYWLLNERRTPFVPLPPAVQSAGDEEAARRRRLSGEAIPAPIHGSPALKAIVLKACAYDPKDRYQSAEDMLRDLDSIGRGADPVQPALHVPQPQPGPVPAHKKRLPWLIPALCGAALLVLALVLLLPKLIGGGDKSEPDPGTYAVSLAAVTEPPATPAPTTEPTSVPTPEASPEPTPKQAYPTREDLLAWYDSGLVRTVSSENYKLLLPTDEQMLAAPFQAKIVRAPDSIYIRPIPTEEKGFGNMGTINSGSIVWILAETDNYYFYTSDNTVMGWARKDFFSPI